jgi:hypothetical protein
LVGPQNHTELGKLSKVPLAKVKRRILGLVDLKASALPLEALRKSYDPLTRVAARNSDTLCQSSMCIEACRIPLRGGYGRSESE